jgi:F-type H+-transporting ATPase subunit epsilon
MSGSLTLSVLSPERKLVQQVAVKQVVLPGSEGQIEILPGHAAMVGTLETGLFRFELETGGSTLGVISSGFFEVQSGGQVQVLAETLELDREIDVARARKAQQLAEETLREADLDPHRFNKYQLKLQRALVRQRIGMG